MVPVLVSGRSAGALRAQAGRLGEYLAGHPGAGLADVAYSLAVTRSHFEHRAVVVADRAGLEGELAGLAAGQPGPGTVLGQRDVTGKVVFVFPGAGSHWTGMARSLLASSAVFAEQVRACEQALEPYLDWSLAQVLSGGGGGPSLDDVDVVQPVLFAVMVSLAALWRSMGIQPDAVVGHSQGEIAAACVAGALTLQDAAKVVALRSRALKRLAGHGAMAAVGLPEAELRERLEGSGGELCLAAVNSPVTSLVSGPPAAVQALVRELAGEGVFAKVLRVGYASHSPQVDVIEEEIRTALAGLAPRESALAFYSALTGERADTTGLDGEYWYRSLRQPVQFAAVSQRLLADGYRFFVEASPHPALLVPLLETADQAGAGVVAVGSLRRDRDDLGCLLRSLGELHSRGLEVDWDGFFRPLHPHRVDLPTYAFQRERFWLQNAGPADVAAAGLTAAGHPLLGAAVTLAGSDALMLTGRLSLAGHRWLAGHVVFGQVIVPGSVFVELALTAAHRAGLDQVDELTLETPLAITPGPGTMIQLTVGPPDETGRRPVTIHARPADAAKTAPGPATPAGYSAPTTPPR